MQVQPPPFPAGHVIRPRLRRRGVVHAPAVPAGLDDASAGRVVEQRRFVAHRRQAVVVDPERPGTQRPRSRGLLGHGLGRHGLCVRRKVRQVIGRGRIAALRQRRGGEACQLRRAFAHHRHQRRRQTRVGGPRGREHFRRHGRGVPLLGRTRRDRRRQQAHHLRRPAGSQGVDRAAAGRGLADHPPIQQRPRGSRIVQVAQGGRRLDLLPSAAAGQQVAQQHHGKGAPRPADRARADRQRLAARPPDPQQHRPRRRVADPRQPHAGGHRQPQVSPVGRRRQQRHGVGVAGLAQADHRSHLQRPGRGVVVHPRRDCRHAAAHAGQAGDGVGADGGRLVAGQPHQRRRGTLAADPAQGVGHGSADGGVAVVGRPD
ncbi:MAG: hypothetical protein BIFFINMI_04224 [Phycisphaerae bacterium]|nr:hypothetical protein [Phycisphaerae bacterium]